EAVGSLRETVQAAAADTASGPAPVPTRRIGPRRGCTMVTMRRRQFLQAMSGLAAARGYAAEFADDRPKRVGLIGCGWYGKSDIFRLVQIAPVEIVALCDVDKKNLEEAANWAVERKQKKPQLFTDYREMLKQGGLDMVEIATPDHWHALTMIEAAKSGVDMYVQKPISVDVVE